MTNLTKTKPTISQGAKQLLELFPKGAKTVIDSSTRYYDDNKVYKDFESIVLSVPKCSLEYLETEVIPQLDALGFQVQYATFDDSREPGRVSFQRVVRTTVTCNHVAMVQPGADEETPKGKTLGELMGIYTFFATLIAVTTQGFFLANYFKGFPKLPIEYLYLPGTVAITLLVTALVLTILNKWAISADINQPRIALVDLNVSGLV